MIRAFALAMIALPAAAQDNCGQRDTAVASLTQSYGEAPVIVGISGGTLIEWWANPETQTWTLMQTMPDGTVCIIGVGTGLAVIPASGEPA